MHEEDAIRQQAWQAKLGKAEVFARLIYAESLSTGYWAGRCSVDGGADELFRAVGWGIANRFRETGTGTGQAGVPEKAVYDTVFRRNQFRTSFSGRGKPNPFAQAFLCPLKSQEYLDRQTEAPSARQLVAGAKHAAERILQHLDEGKPVPAPFGSVTNFFYPRSERYGEQRPAWAPVAQARLNRGYLPILASPNPCVEFYDLGSRHP